MKNHILLKVSVSLCVFGALSLGSCNKEKRETVATSSAPEQPAPLVLKPAPEFSGDNAFNQVAKQVAFGPRVPNTEAHRKCGEYIQNYLKGLGWEVVPQKFTDTAFNGTVLNLTNIIATYNPKAAKRILLAAHWDTRPFADQDSKDKNKPIDGANDGGSGVAVLLEVARVIAEAGQKPEVGVDLIFFDGEDYGETEEFEEANPNNEDDNQAGKWWCLGSQYWSANKHNPNYTAYYGILLDMVGGRDAKFAKDGTSMHFAPSVVEKVWSIAQKLGYTRFMNSHNAPIIDDHLFVNQRARINMIDIIEYDETDGNYFSKTWHKHSDNLENIDKQTLKEVGQTVVQVLYQE